MSNENNGNNNNENKIVDVVRHDATELIAGLRQVRIRGFGQPRIYENCEISVEGTPLAGIVPPQTYYLQSRVFDIITLRIDILDQFGFDIFWHEGWVEVVYADGRKRPFMPPVVEGFNWSDSVSCWLACDGVHRLVAHKMLGIDCPLVSVISRPDWPYYAVVDPAATWSGLTKIVGPLPEGFEKKRYRIPVDRGDGVTVKQGGSGFAQDEAAYKLLFRDFNAVWPGVQEDRPKGAVR